MLNFCGSLCAHRQVIFNKHLCDLRRRSTSREGARHGPGVAATSRAQLRPGVNLFDRDQLLDLMDGR
jgi:hypothetical protein